MKSRLPHPVFKFVIGSIIFVAFCAFVLPFLIPLPTDTGIDPTTKRDLAGRFLSFDGYQAYITEKNQKESKAIVLLHGFGGNATTWNDTQTALASAGYRVIAIDLKGFGYSFPRTESDNYSFSSQADYVARIMRLLNVSHATVVGHSMGASIAAILATEYPDLVDRLVFIDPSLPLDKAAPSTLATTVMSSTVTHRWVRLFASYGISKQWMRSKLESAYAGQTPTYTMVDVYYSSTTVKGWKDSLVGIVRDSTLNTMQSSSLRTDLPVLILWGEKDTWIPKAESEKITKTYEKSTLVLLDGVGHVPQEVVPSIVSSHIVSFLKR